MFAHLPFAHVVGLATLLFTHSLCAGILHFLISTRATVGTSDCDCQYATDTTNCSAMQNQTSNYKISTLEEAMFLDISI